MNSRYRIVLTGNHNILREGLRLILSREKDFEIVGGAGTGQEGVCLVEETKPDLVVSDLSAHPIDGMEMIETIKKQTPNIKVAAIAAHQDEQYVFGTIKAGADGYILMDVSCSELVMAVRSILKGKRYLSPEILGDLYEGYLEEKRVEKVNMRWKTVSEREREILNHIARGLTNKQIADQICISMKTVAVHRSKIMKKLNVHNAPALIRVAIEKGLIHQ